MTTSTTMRKNYRSAVPLPVAALTVIIGLLFQPSDAFSFVANAGSKSFRSATAMTPRTTKTSLTPLSMTFTMPIMPKLEFNAGDNGAIWYESCVDPKARLPAYDEE